MDERFIKGDRVVYTDFIFKVMKTIKLSNEEAELVVQAISAYIREEQREQMTAEERGLNIKPYENRIGTLVEIKQIINNQLY